MFAGNNGRTGRRYVLTSGLAVCGVCGAPLAGCKVNRAEGTVPYLRCQPSKGGAHASASRWSRWSAYVADELFAALDSPEFLAALAADDHAHGATS